MAQRRAANQNRSAAVMQQPERQPALMTSSDAVAALLADDDGVSIVKVDDALASITRSEVEMQLSAAHRWPRDIKRFLAEAEALACFTRETAQTCIYTLPVRKGGDKPITGPSIRLAEICATSWGNLHTGARIMDEGDRSVTAQALVWDLEKNVRIGIEVKRGIVTSAGHRFGDDMIRVTAMAAVSIALRNAIFRIVPGALVGHVYGKATEKATGVTDGAFEKELKLVMSWFINKKGVPAERIFARLGIAQLSEMTPDHLATLIGFGSAIKQNEATPEEIFAAPPRAAAPAGGARRGAALDTLTEVHKRKSEPPPAPAATSITAAELLAGLVHADAAWEGEGKLAIVEQWSEDQRRVAHDWVAAFNGPGEDADLPVRPAFTMLGRQPGEDG